MTRYWALAVALLALVLSSSELQSDCDCTQQVCTYCKDITCWRKIIDPKTKQKSCFVAAATTKNAQGSFDVADYCAGNQMNTTVKVDPATECRQVALGIMIAIWKVGDICTPSCKISPSEATGCPDSVNDMNAKKTGISGIIQQCQFKLNT